MQCSYTKKLDGFCGAGKYLSKNIFHQANELYAQEFIVPSNVVLFNSNTIESIPFIISKLQRILEVPGDELGHVMKCNSCPDNYTSPLLSNSFDNCTLVTDVLPKENSTLLNSPEEHEEYTTQHENTNTQHESDNSPEEHEEYTTQHENTTQHGNTQHESDNSPEENTTLLTESDNSHEENTTLLTESDNSPEENTTLLTESDNSPEENTTLLTESDNSPEEHEENTNTQHESDNSPEENTTLLTESDNSPEENTTLLTESDNSSEEHEENTTLLTESDNSPEENTTLLTESDNSPEENTTLLTESDNSPEEPEEIKQSKATENPQSQDTYTVRMVLSVAMTIETFDYEVQTRFKDALARAAGVESNAVSIDSIVAKMQRRLLSGGIVVKTSILALDKSSASTMMSLLSSDNINDNLLRSGMASVIVVEQAQSGKTIVAGCAKNTYQQCDQTGKCSSCASCPDKTISVQGSKSILNCTKSNQVFYLDVGSASFFSFENWPRQHSLKFRENTFDANTEITMRMVTDLSIFADPASVENKDILYLQSNNSEVFTVPVTLTITYTEERPGFVPTIETYDDVVQEWVEVNSNYKNNKLLKTVSVDVTHFSFWTSGSKPTGVDYYRPKKRDDSDNSFSTKLNMFMLFVMSLMFVVCLFFINRFISQAHRRARKNGTHSYV